MILETISMNLQVQLKKRKEKKVTITNIKRNDFDFYSCLSNIKRSFVFEFWGINNVDSSLYPSCELQFDWLTAYLESFKWFSGVDSTVTKKEVLEIYVQVCKFSLVSILGRLREGARLTVVKLAMLHECTIRNLESWIPSIVICHKMYWKR